ncbi:MAG: prepilin-type N-terminal cleavage/methylation domain-containing protein [Phycisphaerae bacterium]|nr:prepilin-type N-terminal cleavage/methylation domain-containing protein [Phycisphaerae bacterium]
MAMTFRYSRACPARSRAFTLVELMVVVLILGALAFMAIPRIGQSVSNAKINTCNANIEIMNKQLELFKAQTGNWPQNYNKFSTNLDYFPDGPPQCPFGTGYKLDTGIYRIIAHNH